MHRGRIMSTQDKLIERFKRQPVDFTWNELVKLFSIFGYTLSNKGKTSGSRVIFVNGDSSYIAHKPHPEKFIKSYVMKQILDFIKINELEEQLKNRKEH